MKEFSLQSALKTPKGAPNNVYFLGEIPEELKKAAALQNAAQNSPPAWWKKGIPPAWLRAEWKKDAPVLISPIRGRLYKPVNLPVARFEEKVHIKRETAYILRHHDVRFVVYAKDLRLATQQEVDNYLKST